MNPVNPDLHSSLELLPSDILADVVLYLSGELIQKLFACGASLLCMKLKSPIVVRHLDFHAAEVQRIRGLGQVRRYENLQTLRIVAFDIKDSLGFVHFEALSQLPTSITELEFAFANADQCWHRIDPTNETLEWFDFKSRLPNLKKLHLRRHREYEYLGQDGEIEELLQHLPATLTSLVWPSCRLLGPMSIDHMIELQELDVPRSGCTEEALQQIGQLAIRKLSVSHAAFDDNPKILPQSLTSLTVAHQWGYKPWFPSKPPHLTYFSAPSMELLSEEHAADLPPTLLCLRFSTIAVPVRLLPSSLTFLKFWLPNSDPRGLQLGLSELPPQLREFKLGGSMASIPALPTWPPTLTKLRTPWILEMEHYAQLPPHLSTLILANSFAREPEEDLPVLPKSVTTRYYHFNLGRANCDFRIPSTLQTLELENTEWINVSDATRLGKLEVLKWIKSHQGTKWFRSLPEQMQPPHCMSIAAREGHVEVLKWFVSVGLDWRSEALGAKALMNDFMRHTPVLDFLLTIPSFRSHRLLFSRTIKNDNLATLQHLRQRKVEIPPFALVLACKYSSLETMRYLVEQCILDVNHLHQESQAPLQIVAKSQPSDDSLPIAQYLHSKGARIDILDGNGYTLAHIICQAGRVPLAWLKWLASAGLDLNRCCAQGNTPLDVLQKRAPNHNEEALAFLIMVRDSSVTPT